MYRCEVDACVAAAAALANEHERGEVLVRWIHSLRRGRRRAGIESVAALARMRMLPARSMTASTDGDEAKLAATAVRHLLQYAQHLARAAAMRAAQLLHLNAREL